MSKANEVSAENSRKILKSRNENGFGLKCTLEGSETNLKDLLQGSQENSCIT